MPLVLSILTVTEILAGLLCIAGLIHLLLHDDKVFALYGTLASSLALIMLFFGQRINKDYAGAMTIVIYLVPTVSLLFLLQ